MYLNSNSKSGGNFQVSIHQMQLCLRLNVDIMNGQFFSHFAIKGWAHLIEGSRLGPGPGNILVNKATSDALVMGILILSNLPKLAQHHPTRSLRTKLVRFLKVKSRTFLKKIGKAYLRVQRGSRVKMVILQIFIEIFIGFAMLLTACKLNYSVL